MPDLAITKVYTRAVTNSNSTVLTEIKAAIDTTGVQRGDVVILTSTDKTIAEAFAGSYIFTADVAAKANITTNDYVKMYTPEGTVTSVNNIAPVAGNVTVTWESFGAGLESITVNNGVISINSVAIASKDYVDGRFTSTSATLRQEISNAKTAAISSANGYTDGRIASTSQTLKDYADGVGTTTLSSAKAYTDERISSTSITLKDYADGKASAAETAAKNYADSILGSTSATLRQEISNAKTAAITSANGYTDGRIASTSTTLTSTLQTYADTKAAAAESNAKSAAKTYTDGRISSTSTTLRQEISNAKTTAISSAKTYTDTQIGSLVTANGSIALTEPLSITWGAKDAETKIASCTLGKAGYVVAVLDNEGVQCFPQITYDAQGVATISANWGNNSTVSGFKAIIVKPTVALAGLA